jgi:hypothetical protein
MGSIRGITENVTKLSGAMTGITSILYVIQQETSISIGDTLKE